MGDALTKGPVPIVRRDREMPLAADLYGDVLHYAPSAAEVAGQRWRRLLPGFAVVGVAALAAAWLSDHYGAPLMLMGLLIGLALNFVGSDTRVHPGLGFASQTLLRWGIVLVGSQVTLWQIGALGVAGFATIAVLIAVGILAGVATATALGQDRYVGILAGGSVAICGASAALALSGLIGERRVNQAQLTLVLVAVAAASAFAMSTYPIVATALDMSGRQAGFMIGASIHDVAQALGAGYSFSKEAGETAAIVKLTRVTLLAPTLAVLALLLPHDGSSRGRIGVPWFVLGFLGLVAVNSFWPLPTGIAAASAKATSALLLVAVTATGMRSPMHLLLQQGWRGAMPVLAATLAVLVVGMAGAFLLI
jgi:uncharacterized integral membrane protein (TIGR00698 family)